MTLKSFCVFADTSHETLLKYEKKKDFIEVIKKIREIAEDFFRVTKQIDKMVRIQKFEGAAAGLLNSNLIARELGIREKHSNYII